MHRLPLLFFFVVLQRVFSSGPYYVRHAFLWMRQGDLEPLGVSVPLRVETFSSPPLFPHLKDLDVADFFLLWFGQNGVGWQRRFDAEVAYMLSWRLMIEPLRLYLQTTTIKTHELCQTNGFGLIPGIYIRKQNNSRTSARVCGYVLGRPQNRARSGGGCPRVTREKAVVVAP